MIRREILAYIKKNKVVELAALQRRFQLSTRETFGVVNELYGQGKIAFLGKGRFRYLESGEDAFPLPGLFRPDIDEPHDPDDEPIISFGEDEKTKLHPDHDAVKPHEQALMKQVQRNLYAAENEIDDDFEAFFDEDDGDDENRGDDENDGDDGDDGDGGNGTEETPEKLLPMGCLESLFNLRGGMEVRVQDGRIFVIPPHLDLFGSGKFFELKIEDGKVYLTDGGIAIAALKVRTDIDEESKLHGIYEIVSRKEVSVCGKELRIYIPTPSAALASLMKLYAAMEAVYNTHGTVEEIRGKNGEDDDDDDDFFDDTSFLDGDDDFFADDKGKGEDLGCLRRPLFGTGEWTYGDGKLTATPPQIETNTLKFPVGTDVNGGTVYGELAKMSHLLIGGATNSGKTVFLHSMITSLAEAYSPQELMFILVDPKRVEFSVYGDLPHLLAGEVVTDLQPCLDMLDWTIREMEKRYALFMKKSTAKNPVRNIDEYNEKREGRERRLPRIVLIVDELADLALVSSGRAILDRILRLTQKSRAAGIHLVLSTQVLQDSIVTDQLRANVPSRIAFRTVTEEHSELLLDDGGAEQLRGKGDMLYRPSGARSPMRLQGLFVSGKEIMSVIERARTKKRMAQLKRENKSARRRRKDTPETDAVDSTYIKALAVVIRAQSASISLIQRKCQLGYSHAGRIIEWMEKMGYITPFEGRARPRTVLITREEFESKYGPLD